MKHVARSFVLATAMSLGFVGVASASPTLSINPTGNTPDTWLAEPGQSVPTGTPGWVGGTLLADKSGFFTFTFGPPGLVPGNGTGHGNSSFINEFWVGANEAAAELAGNVFCTQPGDASCGGVASNVGDLFTVFLTAGLVPFGFTYDQSGGNHTLVNGQRDDTNGAYIVNTSLDSLFAGPSTFALIGLSDNAFPVDSDFQDLTVGVTVPEPASLAVFGISLIGLAGIRRRRRALG